MGICCLRSFLPSPGRPFSQHRTSWHREKGLLGEWVLIGSSVTSVFSNSNEPSIFSRKVGNLWVHVVPRKEGQTAPDIPLTACLRWNCDENKELFTHHGLPCAKVRSKNPSCFSDPYHVPRLSTSNKWISCTVCQTHSSHTL